MIRTFKWIYKLGYNNSRNSLLTTLERARDFHLAQEQIKGQREFDERDTGFKHKVTPIHHEQRRKALEDVLNQIDPEKYPNIDNFMDLLS